jgi:hypothetical protein
MIALRLNSGKSEALDSLNPVVSVSILLE